MHTNQALVNCPILSLDSRLSESYNFVVVSSLARPFSQQRVLSIGDVKAKKILVVVLFIATPAYANPSIVRTANPVSDEYIVILQDATPVNAVDGLAHSIAASYGGTVRTVWSDALKGFLFEGPDAAAVNLATDPRVAFVEENGVSYGLVPPLSVSTIITDPNTGSYNWLWHLDRLDEKTAPGDNSYNLYNTGQSVYAYVIDSGRELRGCALNTDPQ